MQESTIIDAGKNVEEVLKEIQESFLKTIVLEIQKIEKDMESLLDVLRTMEKTP